MINFVAKIGVDDFHGPSQEDLQTNFLHDEVQKVIIDLELLKQSWRKYGCNIVSNGWNDMKKNSIINILVSTCRGTMFLDSIDTFELVGQPMTIEYIYGHIKNAIEIVGPENVAQVIIDNASNYKAMSDLSIVWMPSVTHCLDLLIEDIAKLPWIKNVITKAKHIVNFMTKKPKVLAIYMAFKDLEL